MTYNFFLQVDFLRLYSNEHMHGISEDEEELDNEEEDDDEEDDEDDFQVFCCSKDVFYTYCILDQALIWRCSSCSEINF